MKINNRLFTVIILAVLLIFPGCKSSALIKNPKNDQYNAETDMQYFYKGDSIGTAKIQETADGCYLYHQGFVYHYENQSQKIEPLCCKLNCLHDREKDPEKLKESQCPLTLINC